MITPEERKIRFEVGCEIIEDAILDFLECNGDRYYNTRQVHEGMGLGLEYNQMFGDMLAGLCRQGKIEDHKKPKAPAHRWQI